MFQISSKAYGPSMHQIDTLKSGADTRHESKTKFGKAHRSTMMKKRNRNVGRRTDNDLRNSGNICSALARRRSRIARGVSSFVGRSVRSWCRETCPTSVRMHRYSLSSSSLFGGRPPPRAFLFPRDLFWSTRKHLRQLRGGGPPPGLSYKAGAYLSRFSLACQLRVPLSASRTLLPPLILASTFTKCCRTLSTSVAPLWFFSHLLSLRSSCTFLFLFPPPPSNFNLLHRLLLSCQFLAFLRVF